MTTATKPATRTNVIVTLLHPSNGWRHFEGYYDTASKQWTTAAGVFDDAAISAWVALTTVRALSWTE